MGLNREFPGSLVVRTQQCPCWGMGKDEGTKTPQAAWCGQKKQTNNKTKQTTEKPIPTPHKAVQLSILRTFHPPKETEVNSHSSILQQGLIYFQILYKDLLIFGVSWKSNHTI